MAVRLNEYFEFEPRSMAHAVEGGYGGGSFSRLSSELERTAIYFGAATQSAATFASTISAFTEFDKQLRLTNAVADGTAQSFEAMRKAALEFSTSTTTSATQAASAMYFLASAGFSVKESVQAMGAVLLLAQGTLSDVGHTADTVAAAISSFGLKASDAGQIADIMAASVSKSQGTMEKLAYALRQVGPVAEYTNQSFRETVTQLSLLFNAGLRGEQAGTALRNSLLRLSSPTQIAADDLRALGVRTIDPLTLQFVGLKNVLEQLATKNLGPQVIKSLVGDESAAGFTVLLGSVKARTDATKQIQDADAKFKAAQASSGGIATPDTDAAKKKLEDLTTAYDKMYGDLDPAKHSSLQMAREQMMSFGAQIDLAKNQMTAFGMAIGEASLRAVMPFVSALGTLGMKLSELGPKQQEGIVQFGALSAALVLTVTNFKKLEDGIRTVITLNAAQWATGAANGLTNLSGSARNAAATVATAAAAGAGSGGGSPLNVALLQERRAQQLLANRIAADTLPLAEILAGGTALSGAGIAALRRSNTPLSQVEGVGRNAPGPWMQNIMASTGYASGRALTAEEEAARGPGTRAPSATATVTAGGLGRAATQAETEIAALGRSAATAGAGLKTAETAATATGIGFLGWAAKLSVITLVGSELIGMFAGLYKAMQDDKDFVYFDADAHKKAGDATLRTIDTERRNTGNNARALESYLALQDQYANQQKETINDMRDPNGSGDLLSVGQQTAMQASLKYIADELKKEGLSPNDISEAQKSFREGGNAPTYYGDAEGGFSVPGGYNNLTDAQAKEAQHQGELANNMLQKSVDTLKALGGDFAAVRKAIEDIKKQNPELSEKIIKAYQEQKAVEAKNNDPNQIDAISTFKMQSAMRTQEASTEAAAEAQARRLMGGDPRAIYQELLAQNTSQTKQAMTTLLNEVATSLKSNTLFNNFNVEGMLGLGHQPGFINTVDAVTNARRSQQQAPGSLTTDGVQGNNVYGYLKSIGANGNEAALLTSAAGSESSFRPDLTHDGGIGYGLFGHNGARLSAMRQYAGVGSSDNVPYQKQLEFALQELRSRPESADVNAARTPEQVTDAQMRFELPKGWNTGGGNYGGRLALTRQYMMGAPITPASGDPSMGAAAVMTGDAWRATPIGNGNMPGTPGSQPLTVKISPTDLVPIGDSIANGFRNKASLPDQSITIPGKDEAYIAGVIKSMKDEDIRGKNIVLSTGASNDPTAAHMDAIVDQLKELRKHDPASISVMGVGPGVGGKFDAAGYNESIERFARANGARFLGPLDIGNTTEGIHPSPQEYQRQIGLATNGVTATGGRQTFAGATASGVGGNVPGLPGVQQGVGAYTLSPEADQRVTQMVDMLISYVLANRAKADMDKNPSIVRVTDEQIASMRVSMTNVLRGSAFGDVNALDQANRAERQRSQAAFNQQRGLTTAQQDTAVARATVEPGNVEGVAQAQIDKDIADRFTKMQNMILTEQNQAITERRLPNFSFLQQYQTTENEGAAIRARQLQQAVPAQRVEYQTTRDIPTARTRVDVDQLQAGRSAFTQDYGATAAALQNQAANQVSLDFTTKILAAEKELADFRNNTKYSQQDTQVKSHIADLTHELDLIKQQRDQELALANSAEGAAKAQHDAAQTIAADFTRMHEYSGNFFQGLQGGAKEWIAQQKTMFDTGKDAFKTFADGIGNSFADLFTNGALGPKKALATIQTTLNDLSKMLLKSFFNQAIVNPLLKSFGLDGSSGGGDNSGVGPAGSSTSNVAGGSGAGGTGILGGISNLASGAATRGLFGGITDWLGITKSAAASSTALELTGNGAFTNLDAAQAAGFVIPNALGNVYMNGRIVPVTPFAQGGAFANSIVTAPTLFPIQGGAGMMGEAGPEAIMPLRRSASGELGIAGGSGHSINYNPSIQVNMGGGGRQGRPDPRDAQALTESLHAATHAAVIDTVRNEQRPGGMLYRQQNGIS